MVVGLFKKLEIRTMEQKIYWLGEGTIGNIRTGDEIPEGLLSEKRLKYFKSQNLIGTKVVSASKNENQKDKEIKVLSDSVDVEKNKLVNALKEIDKLAATLTEVTAAKTKALDDLTVARAKIKELKKKADGSLKTDASKAGPR